MTETAVRSETSWFYTQAEQSKGPVSTEVLKQLLSTRAIDGETPVWRKGLSDWQPLRNSELASDLPITPEFAASQSRELFG